MTDSSFIIRICFLRYGYSRRQFDPQACKYYVQPRQIGPVLPEDLLNGPFRGENFPPCSLYYFSSLSLSLSLSLSFRENQSRVSQANDTVAAGKKEHRVGHYDVNERERERERQGVGEVTLKLCRDEFTETIYQAETKT